MNLAAKLKIRCPSCAKLYEVESGEVHSELPLFQCISCDSRFSFEFPPTDPGNIVCFVIPTKNSSETTLLSEGVATTQRAPVGAFVAAPHGEMKSCPKCGAMNGRRAKECYSCHVLFERLEGLPQDTSLKAQPSLVRKWKNLVHNFENEALHEEFLMACHQLDALRFATLKYEELKSAQGGDPQCDIMLARIQSLMLVGLSQQSTVAQAKKSLVKPKWQKYLFWGPFGLSGLLILLGTINLAHRNLVGVGVAFAIMSAGLIVMIRGRLQASDFFD